MLVWLRGDAFRSELYKVVHESTILLSFSKTFRSYLQIVFDVEVVAKKLADMAVVQQLAIYHFG